VLDSVQGSGASDFIVLDFQESGVVRGALLPPPQSATVVRGETREVREDDDLMFGRDQDARDRERLNLERLLVCSYDYASACVDDAEGNLIGPSKKAAAWRRNDLSAQAAQPRSQRETQTASR
jgi:hypothetical protein